MKTILFERKKDIGTLIIQVKSKAVK